MRFKYVSEAFPDVREGLLHLPCWSLLHHVVGARWYWDDKWANKWHNLELLLNEDRDF